MTNELQAAKAMEYISPTLWEYIILGFISIMAYFLKNRDERLTASEKEISALDKSMRDKRSHDLEYFVSRQDFKDTVQEIKETNKRIFEKIDQILDKVNTK